MLLRMIMIIIIIEHVQICMSLWKRNVSIDCSKRENILIHYLSESDYENTKRKMTRQRTMQSEKEEEDKNAFCFRLYINTLKKNKPMRIIDWYFSSFVLFFISFYSFFSVVCSYWMGRKRLSSSDSTTTVASNSPSKLNNLNSGGMQQRNAANARERARMRVLSKAFIKLKTHLPWVRFCLFNLFFILMILIQRFHMIQNYPNSIHFV